MKYSLTALSITALFIAGGLGVLALPQQASAQVSPDLLQLVSQLTQQLEDLKAQLREVQQTRQALHLTLSRHLERGLSGEDVRELQSYLAQKPAIYPEALVTGFYGPLTEQAVKRFQRLHGLQDLGAVDAVTAETIKSLRAAELRALTGRLSWAANDSDDPTDDDDEDNDADDDSDTETEAWQTTICHIPPGNPLARHTLRIGQPAVRAHLAHGDTLGACGSDDSDDDENDVTAPMIDDLTVTDVASTTAVISWTTDEPATGVVYYGTETPLDLNDSDTEMVSDDDLTTDHAFTLEDLAEDTTYYYLVKSADEADNTATSTEASFDTL